MFQYKIRTMLLVLLLAAMVSMLLGVRLQQFLDQEKAVGELKQLRGAVLTVDPVAWLDWPLQVCFGKDRINFVTHIQIKASRQNTFGTCEHLTFLKHFRWVKSIDISGDFVGPNKLSVIQQQKFDEALSGLDQLEDVRTDVGGLSVAAFDSLKRRGVAVSHLGLSDFVLAENFVFSNHAYKELNLSESSLSLHLKANSPEVWVGLDAEFEKGIYGPEYSDGFMELYLPASLVVGETKTHCPPVKDLEELYDCNRFYNGVHQNAYDFKTVMLKNSPDGMHLRIEFRLVLTEFDITDKNADPVVVNCHLPVSTISIEFPDGRPAQLDEVYDLISACGFEIDPSDYHEDADLDQPDKCVLLFNN